MFSFHPQYYWRDSFDGSWLMMLKPSRETKLKNIWITSSFSFRSDSITQRLGFQWTRPQILCQSAAQDALPEIQTVLSRSLGPPALNPRGRGLETHQTTERWPPKVFWKGHFLLSHLWLHAPNYCVRYKSPAHSPPTCVETLREDLFLGTERFSGEFWCLVISGLWYWVHDAKTLRNYEARPANKTHFCLFQVSLEVEILSPSSCTGSWSSNEVAPATTDEIRVASYLIISAAFNDYDPKLNIT
jgi:hypothetical protein